MTEREQRRQPALPPESASPVEPDDTREVRAEGAALLAAAEAAIGRVLSRNSAEFLAQNRQQGGQ